MIGLFLIWCILLHQILTNLSPSYDIFVTIENAVFPCICKGIWHFFVFVPLFLYSSSNIRLEPLKRFRVNEQVIFVVTAGENYRKKDMSKSSYSGIMFV